ncbi:MAG TPA: hypothetical protein VII06_21730 [Chloroflexota bacterium]|jgi:photosystem II stability/assembly factor-like uncharacterized protein
MQVVIGTREGAFVVGEGGAARAADGLAGPGVHTLRRANGSVVAGTEDGVYCSDDAGRSWRASGCAGQDVWSIAAAPPDGRVLYAGTHPAALYRSEDGGRSWAALNTFGHVPGSDRWGLPGDPTGSRALAVVLDAAQPSRFWVGVEVGGILETEDDGASWRFMLAGRNPDIHGLVRDPARPEVFYATTGFGRLGDGDAPEAESTAGVYRSEDGGRTWRYVWGDLERRYTRPICVDARAPHALTVAGAPTFRSCVGDPGGAQAMVYQSTDGGTTWRSLGDAAHSPSAANLMAVAPAASRSGSVVVGTETGEVWHVSPEAEWTPLASGLPPVSALLSVD